MKEPVNNLWQREQKKIKWKGINLYLSTLPVLVFQVRSEYSTGISRHINMISSYRRLLARIKGFVSIRYLPYCSSLNISAPFSLFEPKLLLLAGYGTNVSFRLLFNLDA